MKAPPSETALSSVIRSTGQAATRLAKGETIYVTDVAMVQEQLHAILCERWGAFGAYVEMLWAQNHTVCNTGHSWGGRMVEGLG